MSEKMKVKRCEQEFFGIHNAAEENVNNEELLLSDHARKVIDALKSEVAQFKTKYEEAKINMKDARKEIEALKSEISKLKTKSEESEISINKSVSQVINCLSTL